MDTNETKSTNNEGVDGDNDDNEQQTQPLLVKMLHYIDVFGEAGGEPRQRSALQGVMTMCLVIAVIVYAGYTWQGYRTAPPTTTNMIEWSLYKEASYPIKLKCFSDACWVDQRRSTGNSDTCGLVRVDDDDDENTIFDRNNMNERGSCQNPLGPGEEATFNLCFTQQPTNYFRVYTMGAKHWNTNLYDPTVFGSTGVDRPPNTHGAAIMSDVNMVPGVHLDSFGAGSWNLNYVYTTNKTLEEETNPGYHRHEWFLLLLSETPSQRLSYAGDQHDACLRAIVAGNTDDEDNSYTEAVLVMSPLLNLIEVVHKAYFLEFLGNVGGSISLFFELFVLPLIIIEWLKHVREKMK